MKPNRKRRRLVPIIILLTVVFLVVFALARRARQIPLSEETTPDTVDNPSPGGIMSSASAVKVIKDEGGRVDWSSANGLIVFDSPGVDNYSDVYVMKSDGSGKRCVTCDKLKLPGKHMGNPAWHPSGKYIVFMAEKLRHSGSSELAKPGRGAYNDLWLADAEGNNFWRLTDLPVPPATGVLHPHFSNDGSMLLWSERLGNGGLWGVWALKVADFGIINGRPELSNIKTYQPGTAHHFYESHGFTPDDKNILFSANMEEQSETGFDIYKMSLATGKFVNLTNTPDVWDEHGQISPDGKKIVWVSSQDLKVPKLDMWIMNADGSNKHRLTYFEDARAESLYGFGGAIADSSWSPDGKKLVAFVITDNKLSLGKTIIIDLERIK